MSKTFYCGIFSTALVVLSSVSCSKKDIAQEPPTQIHSILPNIIKGGDTIRVFGSNLIKDLSNTTLSLNGHKAEIFLATSDSIKALVPPKAGSGTVVLEIGGETIEGPAFDYDYKVTVTTIAGNGYEGNTDGPAFQASFKCPWGITSNAAGDLFVADSYNRLIRKISAVDFSVSSYVIPADLNFAGPYNLTIDTVTQKLYVTDFNAHLLRMDPSGQMEVIFEDRMPLTGVAINPARTHLYISNNNDGTIVRTDLDGKNAFFFASGLRTPRNIVFNHKSEMYVAAYPGPIYAIDSKGVVTRKGSSQFGGWEIATDTSGNFFLADHFSNCIRMIDKSGRSKIIAGSGEAADVDGIGLESAFDGPQGIAIDNKGNLYVTTYNYENHTGNRIRKIVLE